MTTRLDVNFSSDRIWVGLSFCIDKYTINLDKIWKNYKDFNQSKRK